MSATSSAAKIQRILLQSNNEVRCSAVASVSKITQVSISLNDRAEKSGVSNRIYMIADDSALLK